MTDMIPKVKAWRVTFDDGMRWIVWGPTRTLAILNARAAGLYHHDRISRYPTGDSLPVPVDLVQPFHPHDH